ncbi:MAG TPA: carbamoyltransferase HypF [Armatimonadota bacterium]|nr:carbamoyltransferase HypF [Armatimonadota bacterium]HOS42813.1 carbamoyltransferase HypF [Armatimonadota bacterium]
MEHLSTSRSLRLRAVIHGAVQGVGFRPFVYRLADELSLAGWVSNTAQGVVLEVEGAREALAAFRARLEAEAPPHAVVQHLEASWLDAAGYVGFEIRHSDAAGAKTALVLPDLATCAACRRELFDPADRRYRYPFINCTHCGPRYSIIRALPYDRPNTTMRGFPMCPACRAEYDDPRDRRFHAQPNACPACGPRVEWWDASGAVLAARDDAARAAAAAIRDGLIVAVKGVGGFHLLADARDDDAVRRLRARKGREAKPFALMAPSLDAARELCEVSADEARLLCASAAPMVLLRSRLDGVSPSSISPAIAPGNPYLGVMLPYTPLHHLLLAELGFAVVATSGNRSDEPICTDEREALIRLHGIADAFLVHDRPIARHVDDSIARVILGREQVLRRARGYAPLPAPLPGATRPLLAVGAHLKGAVAIAVDGQAMISQHLGDLETEEAHRAFREAAAGLGRLYDARPEAVICDRHPDYRSTRYADSLGLPVLRVQHHYAHVRACMAEHGLDGPVLGVAWDGAGYGDDGTIWGGEFLLADGEGYTRAAHLRPFRLPGGDAAAREPRRSALGVLYALFGDALFTMDLPLRAAFSTGEWQGMATMLARGVNAPLTTSAGRLFDAAAALAGLRQYARFEGQAAMELEFCLTEDAAAYPFALAGPVVDWAPTIRALLADAGAPAGVVSARFHHALAAMIVAVARAVGVARVALTGGCFQNRYLTERSVDALRAAGFRPYWHQRVPPNDGGIALGQLAAAAMLE